MTRLIFLASLLASLIVVVAHAQSSIPAPSTWTNERGSIMTIQSASADGVFSGTFVNKADRTFCKDDPYLLEGRLEGDKIWFAVAFADRADANKNCMTVTSWHGSFSAKVIETTWSLAYPGPNGLIVIGGSDTFSMQP